jgi:hypothetical protein
LLSLEALPQSGNVGAFPLSWIESLPFEMVSSRVRSDVISATARAPEVAAGVFLLEINLLPRNTHSTKRGESRVAMTSSMRGRDVGNTKVGEQRSKALESADTRLHGDKVISDDPCRSLDMIVEDFGARALLDGLTERGVATEVLEKVHSFEGGTRCRPSSQHQASSLLEAFFRPSEPLNLMSMD